MTYVILHHFCVALTTCTRTTIFYPLPPSSSSTPSPENQFKAPLSFNFMTIVSHTNEPWKVNTKLWTYSSILGATPVER